MTWRENVARWLVGATPEQVVDATKAMTGAGAYVLEYHDQLNTLMRDPVKFFRQAQALSRANVWVDTAERIVSGRADALPWHLEDENEDTHDEEEREPYTSARRLLEHPSPLVTWREMAGKTLRHMGVCGNGFWYKDQVDPQGIPLQLFYINPARMTPSEDRGGNLVGWVLDAEDQYRWGKGVPLRLDEVIHFKLDPADWGHYGVGLVESAEQKAALTSVADRYMIQTFGSGGRRGHFISPPDAATQPMPDDVYNALVSGLRNVAESPDAAKRNIVTKSPLKIQAQAMSPNDIGASAIMAASRDDIFAHWGIPLSQTGIAGAAGLNSGDTKKYDEAVLWQGAILPRLDAFRQTLQYQLLDLYPVPVELVFETPTFDDDTPAYDRAVKALDQPLTENERRAILGLDPLPDIDDKGEPLGAAIYRRDGYSVVGAVDENGKVVALAEKPVPPALVPFAGTTEPVPPQFAGKAQREFLGLRKHVDTRWVGKTKTTVQSVLDSQKTEVAKKVRNSSEASLKRQAKNGTHWLGKSEDDRLAAALLPSAKSLAQAVVDKASTLLKPRKAGFESTVLSLIASSVGKRVKGINDTTRDLIAIAISAGVDEGLSPLEVAERIEALTAFDPARAELIARTEMAQVYNDAALGSYREYGVERVEAIDGDEDEVCAARNGETFTLEEAQAIEDHPNGTLDWVPIIEETPQKADLQSIIHVEPSTLPLSYRITYDEAGRISRVDEVPVGFEVAR